LLAGGMSYSVGAVIYVLRRPNPLPHIFGFHEIFHLFVIGGSVAFILVIWLWVVPYTAS
jgi:hemolysin III